MDCSTSGGILKVGALLYCKYEFIMSMYKPYTLLSSNRIGKERIK
jgi:hypothetical protein